MEKKYASPKHSDMKEVTPGKSVHNVVRCEIIENTAEEGFTCTLCNRLVEHRVRDYTKNTTYPPHLLMGMHIDELHITSREELIVFNDQETGKDYIYDIIQGKPRITLA